MNNVQNEKRAKQSSLPFFFKDSFKVSFLIIIISLILLITTFTFEIVPPILNRGIQPATFPKALLILIIFLTLSVYFLSLKNPWKKNIRLPNNFYYTFLMFVFFSIISKTIDFFLGLAFLSAAISYLWGERRKYLIFFVSIIFPILVFILFEVILNLRFPSGIITNLYYE